MRIIALAIATCVTVVAWSQQAQAPASKPSVPDVLTKLHSRHWSERIKAMDEVWSDQGLLHSHEIQAALMDLLDQETEIFREDKNSYTVAAANSDDDGEEVYAEYTASLSNLVNTFVDWNDPRQACTMAYSGDIAYPSSSPEAAARARAVMPCLLKSAKSKFAIYREAANPPLIEALAKAGDTLTPEEARDAKQIVMDDLRDSDAGVRTSAVSALAKFGGIEVIPMLQEIARSDPEYVKKTDTGVEWFPVREAAAKAINAIQKRAAASNSVASPAK